jgi:hypothetical protein
VPQSGAAVGLWILSRIGVGPTFGSLLLIEDLVGTRGEIGLQLVHRGPLGERVITDVGGLGQEMR